MNVCYRTLEGVTHPVSLLQLSSVNLDIQKKNVFIPLINTRASYTS